VSMPLSRLILIAGASTSGKSTMIERLKNGSLPDLCDALGIEDVKSWDLAWARNLSRVQESRCGLLLLHYDLLRNEVLNGLARGESPFSGDDALSILTKVERISIVTQWVEASELARRLSEKRRALVRSVFRRSGRPTRPLRKLTQLSRKLGVVRHPRRLRDLFGSWVSFCSDLGADAHWISRSTGESYELNAAAEWAIPTA